MPTACGQYRCCRRWKSSGKSLDAVAGTGFSGGGELCLVALGYGFDCTSRRGTDGQRDPSGILLRMTQNPIAGRRAGKTGQREIRKLFVFIGDIAALERFVQL